MWVVKVRFKDNGEEFYVMRFDETTKCFDLKKEGIRVFGVALYKIEIID